MGDGNEHWQKTNREIACLQLNVSLQTTRNSVVVMACPDRTTDQTGAAGTTCLLRCSISMMMETRTTISTKHVTFTQEPVSRVRYILFRCIYSQMFQSKAKVNMRTRHVTPTDNPPPQTCHPQKRHPTPTWAKQAAPPQQGNTAVNDNHSCL